MGILAPIAVIIIPAEMLAFCALHLSVGATDSGPLMYWLGVAVFYVFLAYGRFVLKPL